jgi:hypothetical protein
MSSRRDFIRSTTTTVAGLAALPLSATTGAVDADERVLNAYYLRGQMYTIVPRQVREDMQWMADVGTTAVSVGILEQDLYAAVENVAIIAEEAERVGMQLYLVPSRWGGMFAGAPKVPSIFSVTHPDGWILEADGKPRYSTVSGVISSVHDPASFNFLVETAAKAIDLWKPAGIIWDEPKTYVEDYNPLARAALGDNATPADHYRAVANFHGRVFTALHDRYPTVKQCYFDQAHKADEIIEMAAGLPHLAYFGCDGRPWAPEDGGRTENEGGGRQKVLLDSGERFLKAARKNDVPSLWLIENHNLATEDIALMDRRLPDVLEHKVDHLIYYYYPRNVAEPDRAMNVLQRHLRNF